MVDALNKENAFKLFFPKDVQTRPHVTIEYNDDALSNQSGIGNKNILFIGSATAGNPNTIYELNSLNEARAVFQSGDLVRACELAWNPTGSNMQNASKIFALRVDSATPSKLVKGNLTFTSKIYGNIANGISVAWDKDVLTGAYRLTVSSSNDGYSKTYTNIGNLFTIMYKGEKTKAGYSVEKDSSGKATKFHVYAGDDLSTEIATYDLTSALYENVYQVIDAISTLPGFVVSVNGVSSNIPSAFIDSTSNTIDISSTKTSGQPMEVTGIVGDLLNQTRNDQYIEIGADLKTALPEPFVDTPLAGASDGTVPVSWASKFEQARSVDCYYIVPLTSQANIHAELKAFLNEQDQLGYEYRGFVGGDFNESVNDSISRQIALKEPRICLVNQSGYYTSLSGANYHIPGYLMAAYVSGVCSSLDVGSSCTNKVLGALTSLDQVLSGSDLDRLDSNGVIAIEYVNNRGNASSFYRIIEDVTTYNNSNEPTSSLLSLGETVDFLLGNLRIYLEQNYIGMSLKVTSPDVLRAGVGSFLSQQVSNGLIISYDESEIVVTIQGNKAFISFSCVPARSLRNILVQTTFDDVDLKSGNNGSNLSDYNLAVN